MTIEGLCIPHGSSHLLEMPVSSNYSLVPGNDPFFLLATVVVITVLLEEALIRWLQQKPISKTIIQCHDIWK
jgi:hypothetical protein